MSTLTFTEDQQEIVTLYTKNATIAELSHYDDAHKLTTEEMKILYDKILPKDSHMAWLFEYQFQFEHTSPLLENYACPTICGHDHLFNGMISYLDEETLRKLLIKLNIITENTTTINAVKETLKLFLYDRYTVCKALISILS